RPPALEQRLIGAIPDTGDVVDQRVAPHIHDVPLIAGKGDAPRDCGARDAEVAKARPQPAENLISPALGLDELAMFLDVLQQPALVFGTVERVVVILQPAGLDRRVNPAVPIVQLVRLVEGFTRW